MNNVIKITDNNSLIKQIQPVIKRCRKGSFVYIICRKKKHTTMLKKVLPIFRITNKRGIYTYKGIIVIDNKKRKRFINYFDEVIELQ